MDQINLFYTTIKDPLPDFIYDSLKEFSANANTYRPQPEVLRGKLAKKHGVPMEMIFLTAGIDEAIHMFAHAYGRHAYIFTPTYIVYTDVEEFGGKLTQIPSIINNQYQVDTSKKSKASLIYLANPNNPSGVTRRENVLELVDNNPQAIVAIDEAYGAFTNLSVIDKVIHHPNMVVFRSFSKGYGMASNRVGYIIASPNIIKLVKNKTQWCNVSYLSVGAAVASLDHEEYFEKMRNGINNRRDAFIEFIKKKKYTVIPSKINACLIKFKNERKALAFVEYLNKNSIIVSHGNGKSNVGLDNTYVRMSIGTQDQMKQVEKVIDKY